MCIKYNHLEENRMIMRQGMKNIQNTILSNKYIYIMYNVYKLSYTTEYFI